MSYLRYGLVFTYVDGTSKDYIFPYCCGTKDGCENCGKGYIEDYGSIRKESLVELIAHCLLESNYRPTDMEFRQYLVNRLSEQLKVPLRRKPLDRHGELQRLQRKIVRSLKSKEMKELMAIVKAKAKAGRIRKGKSHG